MSKKSWGDGTGDGPEKERKDAKQKHFHSLPVRNRLTEIILEFLTGSVLLQSF